MKAGKPRQMDHSLSLARHEKPIGRLQDLPQNAFGALRLFFASAVIISHAPSILDGSLAREPVFQIFETITAGSLAVIGFFVISGYLITGSYLNSRSVGQYLAKRIARIYPGFVCAFFVSALVGIVVGGGAAPDSVTSFVKRVVDCFALQPPIIDHAFEASALPVLNGSLWTIAYEFRCYVLIMVLGACGLLRSRATITGLAAIGLVLVMLLGFPYVEPTNPYGSNIVMYLVGEPSRSVWLTTSFFVGSIFYLYRDRITFGWKSSAIALFGFAASLSFALTATTGAIIFGSYLTFAAAQKMRWAYRINSQNDISYGVYLYAWPVTKVLELWYPDIHPALLAILTFATVAVLGWASWLWVEKPARDAVSAWLRDRRPFTPDAAGRRSPQAGADK